MSARCRTCNRLTLGKCELCRHAYCLDHLSGKVCQGCEQIRNVDCEIELLTRDTVRLLLGKTEIALSCAEALKLQKMLDVKAVEIRAALDHIELAPRCERPDWF